MENKYKLFHVFAIGILIGMVSIAIMLSLNKPYTQNEVIFKPVHDTLCKESVLYYLNLFDVKQPNIVLKQALLETGNFTSRLCKENNNLFGLKRFSTGQYFKFSHWAESIVMYKWTIQYKYESGCYYEFLDTIGYAEDINYTAKLKAL